MEDILLLEQYHKMRYRQKQGTITIIHKSLIESFQILSDWNECQKIYTNECIKVGITKLSCLYLQNLYDREYIKLHTNKIPKKTSPKTNIDSNKIEKLLSSNSN